MATPTVISKYQALRWSGGHAWGIADRELIEWALSLLPPHELHQTKSYIAAKVNGKTALRIHPAWVEWPKGTWARSIDESKIVGGFHTWGRTDGTVAAQLSNSPWS